MIAIILGIVLIVAFGFAAIPSEVRALIATNCRDTHGRLSLTYLFREVAAVANFFAGAFLVSLVIATVLLFVIGQVGDRLIPLELMGAAVEHVEIDPQATKKNLTMGLDNVSEQHARWYMAKGHSREEARQLQKRLVGTLPFAVPVIFGLILLAIQLTSKSHSHGVQRLLRDEVKRAEQRLRASYCNGD